MQEVIIEYLVRIWLLELAKLKYKRTILSFAYQQNTVSLEPAVLIFSSSSTSHWKNPDSHLQSSVYEVIKVVCPKTWNILSRKFRDMKSRCSLFKYLQIWQKWHYQIAMSMPPSFEPQCNSQKWRSVSSVGIPSILWLFFKQGFYNSMWIE